jgi:hypothetical protein
MESVVLYGRNGTSISTSTSNVAYEMNILNNDNSSTTSTDE